MGITANAVVTVTLSPVKPARDSDSACQTVTAAVETQLETVGSCGPIQRAGLGAGQIVVVIVVLVVFDSESGRARPLDSTRKSFSGPRQVTIIIIRVIIIITININPPDCLLCESVAGNAKDQTKSCA